MYRLYYAPSTASLAVHWMLIELGIPFETVRLDIKDARDQDKPDYRALNPAGTVPTLVVDGVAVAETAAILMLLAERHPERGFAAPAGSPERGPWLQAMMHLTNTLMPAFRCWYYPDEIGGSAAAKAAQGQRIMQVWDRLDAKLADGRPFLLGESLTTADFLLTMLTRWSRNMEKPATAWPHLRAYVDRMRAMPSLREVHAREGLTDWIGG
jgi:glutathione S-transferase